MPKTRPLTRAAFHRLFKALGPVVLPVIHVRDTAETLENVATAIGEGAAGVFLINHDFGPDRFLPIIADVRARHSGLWMGVNILATPAREGVAVLRGADLSVDAYWADDARIDERSCTQPVAEATAAALADWDGLYFGGTAFKKQRPVADAHLPDAARMAADHMDVVTTSGAATGKEAPDAKVETFRRAIGDRPLALASGITPENAERYRDVDAFLVATGINRAGDFYRIDPGRLAALVRLTRRLGGGQT